MGTVRGQPTGTPSGMRGRVKSAVRANNPPLPEGGCGLLRSPAGSQPDNPLIPGFIAKHPIGVNRYTGFAFVGFRCVHPRQVAIIVVDGSTRMHWVVVLAFVRVLLSCALRFVTWSTSEPTIHVVLPRCLSPARLGTAHTNGVPMS